MANDPFAKPMEGARRFLRAKGLKESWDFRDLTPDEHALAFTVAKSAGYDILADIKGALQEAIDNREDFDGFRKRIEPILCEKGWWGKKQIVDATTGEIRIVELGSSRRLRTIFWANVRTAYAAGAWERAWRTRAALPYLIYVQSAAAHPRETHLAWAGIVLPIEDPWWDEHYPPSAWGCQCRTRQVSQWEADENGYRPDAPPPDEGVQIFVNKKTGETVVVPRGVDPAWRGNPGKTRFENAARLIYGKLDAMTPEARRTAAQDLAGSATARRVINGEVDYVKGSTNPANVARGKFSAPVGALTPDLREALGATSSVVRLSVADSTKQFAKRRTQEGELSVPAEKYPILQILIERGEAIAQKQVANDIILQGKVEGVWWLAVLRRAKAAAGEIYLKSFRRTDEARLDAPRERGTVIRDFEEGE